MCLKIISLLKILTEEELMVSEGVKYKDVIKMIISDNRKEENYSHHKEETYTHHPCGASHIVMS